MDLKNASILITGPEAASDRPSRCASPSTHLGSRWWVAVSDPSTSWRTGSDSRAARPTW